MKTSNSANLTPQAPIPLSTESTLNWQQEISQIIRDPAELLQLLDLPEHWLPQARVAAQQFELRVPRSFVARMKRGDINDPLLRQVLPVGAELEQSPGYSDDPLAELNSNPHQGLIHKYHGRVLLVVAPSCAINCRYCFRRHFPYGDNNPGRQQWQPVFDRLAADTSIKEVIFSGGDPLISSDRQLRWLTEQLAAIPHLKRLRVHSRLPVVIPSRITSECLDWLTLDGLQSVMVLHINHPQEIDHSLIEAIQKLRQAGVWVLNQAVLLGGINNQLSTQIELSERLFDAGVQPYYLHLLDRVQGAAHFAVSDSDAIELHREMQARLPGFLVPKLSREEPGAKGKTLVF